MPKGKKQTRKAPGRPALAEDERLGFVVAVRLDAAMGCKIKAMVAAEDRPISRVLRRLIELGLETQEKQDRQADREG